MENFKEFDGAIIFNIAARGYLSYQQRKIIAKQFNLDTNYGSPNSYATIESELRDYYKTNPEQFERVIAKSPRLTFMYCKNRRKRLDQEAENIFIQNCNRVVKKKGTTPFKKYYYEYCNMFNIVVNTDEVLLEVAFGEDDKTRRMTTYRSGKEYIVKMNKEKKKCLEFINQIMNYKNISLKDSIETLIAELSK